MAGEKVGAHELAKVDLPLEAANGGFGPCVLAWVNNVRQIRTHVRRWRRSKAQISFNMSRVRSTGSEIERVMEAALRRRKLRPLKHPKMLGRPDFAFPRSKVAVFCDSHFWHGYNWKTKQKELHRNRSFWVPKILGNMRRDRLVNRCLMKEGWTVLRFWEHQILRYPDSCVAEIRKAISAGRQGRQLCR